MLLYVQVSCTIRHVFLYASYILIQSVVSIVDGWIHFIQGCGRIIINNAFDGFRVRGGSLIDQGPVDTGYGHFGALGGFHNGDGTHVLGRDRLFRKRNGQDTIEQLRCNTLGLDQWIFQDKFLGPFRDHGVAVSRGAPRRLFPTTSDR
jgi:hypothetical protein